MLDIVLTISNLQSPSAIWSGAHCISGRYKILQVGHIAFISHAVEDAEIARQVCHILEKNGIACWIAPRDVPPAAEYGETIVAAVETSKVLVLLLSAPANASRFVMREVSLALDEGIAILPLRLGEVAPGRSLKFFIQGLQRFDAFPPPLEDRIPGVVAAIRGAVSEDLTTQEDQPGDVEPRGSTIVQPVNEAERVVTEIVRREMEKRGFADVQVINNLLIFSTKKQKMWLSFTDAGVVCVLDNRPKGGQIRAQWIEPLADIGADTVSTLDRLGRPGLLRIGSHKNWLYTKALFGSGDHLREIILSEAGRAGR